MECSLSPNRFVTLPADSEREFKGEQWDVTSEFKKRVLSDLKRNSAALVSEYTLRVTELTSCYKTHETYTYTYT